MKCPRCTKIATKKKVRPILGIFRYLWTRWNFRRESHSSQRRTKKVRRLPKTAPTLLLRRRCKKSWLQLRLRLSIFTLKGLRHLHSKKTAALTRKWLMMRQFKSYSRRQTYGRIANKNSQRAHTTENSRRCFVLVNWPNKSCSANIGKN